MIAPGSTGQDVEFHQLLNFDALLICVCNYDKNLVVLRIY